LGGFARVPPQTRFGVLWGRVQNDLAGFTRVPPQTRFGVLRGRAGARHEAGFPHSIAGCIGRGFAFLNQESETGAFPVGVSPAIPTTGFGVSALQAQEIWPDGTGTRSSAFAIGLRPFRPTGSIWWRGYQVFDLRYRLAAFQAWGIWPGQVVRCSESFGPTGPGNLAGWHEFQAFGLRFRLAVFQA